jgi:hypothetical protein
MDHFAGLDVSVKATRMTQSASAHIFTVLAT